MKHAVTSLFVTVLTTAALAAAPADAAAKCSRSGNAHVLPGVLYIVDGKVVADLASNDQKLDEKMVIPDREDILSIEIRCTDVTPPGESRRTMRNTVVIYTMSGVPGVLTSYLQKVDEAQSAHHARTGRYASVPADIAVEKPFELQLELKGADTAWSLSVTHDYTGTTCSVAGGTGAPKGPDLRPIVSCTSRSSPG